MVPLWHLPEMKCNIARLSLEMKAYNQFGIKFDFDKTTTTRIIHCSSCGFSNKQKKK